MTGWHREGRLFVPPDLPVHPALATHAANPLALPLGGNTIRVFYNGRDAANRSAIGAVDIDLATRRQRIHPDPLVLPGQPGSFTVDGLSIGGWVDHAQGRDLLVMGWTMLGGGRWRGEIGRVAATDDGWLSTQAVPVLAPDGKLDPASLSYPCALRDGADRWIMLYESTQPGTPTQYPLHAATSHDGRTWHRAGVALAPVVGLTTGYSRPSVLRIGTRWHLWSSRLGPAGERYHIAHAVSDDGLTWTGMTEPALVASGEGWDAAMVCYPHVFEQGGNRYMLYNGDGFGRTGFGLARWEGA